MTQQHDLLFRALVDDVGQGARRQGQAEGFDERGYRISAAHS